MGNLHLEILDDNRRLIFQKLSSFERLGYLAGGTALALQIGHRISYDNELFSEKLFLAQLVYTDDISSAEVAKTQLLTSKVTLEEVKSYFQQLVGDYWCKTQL